MKSKEFFEKEAVSLVLFCKQHKGSIKKETRDGRLTHKGHRTIFVLERSISLGYTPITATPMEAVHFVLDIVGLIPFFGEIADGINGGLYLIEGNYLDAGLSFAATVPIAGWFATGAKWTKAVVTISRKYGDEATSLIQQTIKKEGGKEIFTITKSGSFKDASTVAKDILGDLGDDAIDHITTTGKGKNPFYGKIVGKKATNGSGKGWRIDWDAENGAHINWWTKNEKGSIPFTGGYEQAKRIIDNILGN